MTFGGTAATNVVVVNSTTITATTPAGSAGAVTVTVTNSGGQSGSLANGFTYVATPTVSECQSEQRVDGGWDGGDDHGDELCGGRDGDVRSCGGDQRGGGEQHDDHGDDAGGECGCGDGDGDSERAERKPGQRVHLCGGADGEKCEPEQRVNGGWNGGDDHWDELCGGGDGDVWEDGGDQRGGGEQHDHHGDDAGGMPRAR